MARKLKTPGSDRTTMTIAMTLEQKRLLKQYALEHDTTSASVVQGWIDKYCTLKTEK